MSQREYPFSPADTQLFDELANRMRMFAYLLIASVVLSTLLTGYQAILMMGSSIGVFITSFGFVFVSEVISLTIAFLTLSASGALAAVSRSGVSDIGPLMHALQSLKRLFGVQYWLIIVFILFILLMMLGMFSFVFMLS